MCLLWILSYKLDLKQETRFTINWSNLKNISSKTNGWNKKPEHLKAKFFLSLTFLLLTSSVPPRRFELWHLRIGPYRPSFAKLIAVQNTQGKLNEGQLTCLTKSVAICGPRPNVIKLFASVIYEFVCPWQAFPAMSNVCGWGNPKVENSAQFCCIN